MVNMTPFIKNYYDYIHIASNKTCLTFIGILENEYDYHVQHITDGSIQLLGDIFFNKGLLDACGVGKNTQITASSYDTGVLRNIEHRRKTGDMTYYDISILDLHFLESRNTTRFYGEKEILNLLPDWRGQFVANDDTIRLAPLHLTKSETKVNTRLLRDVLVGANHLSCTLMGIERDLADMTIDSDSLLGTGFYDIHVAWKAIMTLAASLD